VVSETQVMDALQRMARLVDQQNAGDPDYINMAPSFISLAFQAAQDMIFHGRRVPNGYTEPTLHRRRRPLLRLPRRCPLARWHRLRRPRLRRMPAVNRLPIGRRPICCA
jgi:hypothetical protein